MRDLMKQTPAPIPGFFEHVSAGHLMARVVWIDRKPRPPCTAANQFYTDKEWAVHRRRDHRVIVEFSFFKPDEPGFFRKIKPSGFSVSVAYRFRAFNGDQWGVEAGAWQDLEHPTSELKPSRTNNTMSLADVIRFDQYKHLLPMMQRRAAQLLDQREIPWPE